jgi:hypothetical protein
MSGEDSFRNEFFSQVSPAVSDLRWTAIQDSGVKAGEFIGYEIAYRPFFRERS